MSSWFFKKKSGNSASSSASSGDPGIPSYSQDPNFAWEKEKVKQTVTSIKPQDWALPQPENHTRFVCISDTHTRTKHLQLPPGDVLLHAGDFSNVGHPKDIDEFAEFLSSQPHPHKVIIAGNHDLTFDNESYPNLWERFGHSEQFNCEETKDKVRELPGVTYLEDSGTTINGISIWGSPWQPEFCGWAFNLVRGQPCQDKWDLIPEGMDVLMTHGPPLGYGDLCKGGHRAGCLQLLHTIQRKIKPKYHVFGHIHEDYGMSSDGLTTYINASTCNFNYRPNNPPIIFDLPNKEKETDTT